MDVLSPVRKVYNSTIRRYLPYKFGVLNGVAVEHKFRILDFSNNFGGYEEEICRSIRDNVNSGDSVVIVGGGLGVSSVVAANLVGKNGVIHTFEASDTQYNKIKRTIEINKASDRIELKHSFVSDVNEASVKKYGPSEDATFVAPEDLPHCDVLELDCEGAETNILENMVVRPNTIIVETHGHLGAQNSDVKRILRKIGYEIIQDEVENKSKGIHVLTAKVENAR
jgi:hypothetical protein